MANWIWTLNTATDNQWVCFRKDVELNSIPMHVFADIAVDSKYWLWINGEMAVREGGLKRGPDPHNTYCDKVDIAPFIK